MQELQGTGEQGKEKGEVHSISWRHEDMWRGLLPLKQCTTKVFERALHDGLIQPLLIKGQLYTRPHTGG